MENGTVGLVDTRIAASDVSLVVEPHTAGCPYTGTTTPLVELSLNNNYYNSYYYCYDNNGDDDDILSGVLTQVRQAYVLPPAVSAHGIIAYDVTFHTYVESDV